LAIELPYGDNWLGRRLHRKLSFKKKKQFENGEDPRFKGGFLAKSNCASFCGAKTFEGFIQNLIKRMNLAKENNNLKIRASPLELNK